MVDLICPFAGMKRNSDGETGPAPKRLRPMGDTELRLLVYSKVCMRTALADKIQVHLYCPLDYYTAIRKPGFKCVYLLTVAGLGCWIHYRQRWQQHL